MQLMQQSFPARRGGPSGRQDRSNQLIWCGRQAFDVLLAPTCRQTDQHADDGPPEKSHALTVSPAAEYQSDWRRLFPTFSRAKNIRIWRFLLLNQ